MRKRRSRYDKHVTLTLRWERKIEDCWIGLFWRTQVYQPADIWRRDYWLCLIPCFPLHITRTHSAAIGELLKARRKGWIVDDGIK